MEEKDTDTDTEVKTLWKEMRKKSREDWKEVQRDILFMGLGFLALYFVGYTALYIFKL